MPGERTSPTGGVLAGSAIGGRPRGEVGLDQRHMMLVEPVGDLARSGEPDARMRQDIFHLTTEGTDAMRLADPIWMQSNAHHTTLLDAFGIYGIEVVANLTAEVVHLLATTVQDHIVQLH